MLEVDKLATLRAVLAHGSFSAAAQQLHLTQPAVSRQISQLERRLGVQLVHRTQRGVYPTEAGQLLAQHAQAVIDRLSLAEAELAQLAGLHRGSVRLGSFFTAMVFLSAEVAMVLGDEHPGLAVVDDLVDRDEAFARLARGALDAAIVFERNFEPAAVPDGIGIVPLFDDPARVLLPAQHPLATRETIRIRDLGGETWIRAHGGPAARHVDHLLSQHRLDPAILTAGHGEEPIEAQALVAAGRGIAIAYDLNLIINPGQIVARPLSGCRSVRHVQAAHLPGQHGPAAVAAIKALRQIGQRHARAQLSQAKA
jgi:DNA-binding transcriptional LysR family regulator